MIIYRIAAALALGSSAAFLFMWILTRSRIHSMTAIEKANARIEEATRKDQKTKPADKLRIFLLKNGYKGTLTPVFAGLTFLYLIAALALRILGINGIIGAVAALPLCMIIIYYAFTTVATKRRRKFNRQLLEALKLIAGQIEGGNGPQRAIEQTIPSLQDPLRAELNAVIDSTVASKDLVESLKELEVKYPSKALKMFNAALEIDRDKGGRIEPALRQAASSLQRDFDLSQEAIAEVSQARAEFLGIVAIIGVITVGMVTGGGEQAHQAYTSSEGIIVLCLAGANFAFGIWRVFRIFSKARGEV